MCLSWLHILVKILDNTEKHVASTKWQHKDQIHHKEQLLHYTG
jgi:hypothetical protein